MVGRGEKGPTYASDMAIKGTIKGLNEVHVTAGLKC